MLTLHIADKNYSSWSLRPWLLMRVLGIPFTETLHAFKDDTPGGLPFSRFSPSGRVPALVDGGLTIWDSLAIVEYLAEKFPVVWPADAKARAWARSAAAEMHSGFFAMRSQCSMTCGQRIRLNQIDEALQADLHRLEALWLAGLEQFGGEFLAGQQFSAVDAFYAPVAFRIQSYDLCLSPPALAYAQRLLALPAMREWADAALIGPLDPAHEIEVTGRGTILADYRRPAQP